MSEKKVLVTSALPYVNNVPHLGNIVCIISADVHKRFLKSRGKNVLSVLGTDEHGTTTETKALEEGLTPREIVDKYFAIHKQIYEWFNTDFDCLGRTSDQVNVEVAQDIFTKLNEHGYIVEQTVEQMWDESAEKFLADRFVEGICPHCKFDDAKGDQCDNCGKLLSPEELLEPKSKLTGTTPVMKATNHLFIDLAKLQPDLEKWMAPLKSRWSHNARTTTEAWLKEGLKPRAMTRDLKWGVPVPVKGYEHKVLYSWFDAPIGYISIVKACRDDWESWWKNPDNVELVQFMGKDNIPFHTILFPAFCLGAQDKYTLMHSISVNEYLNYKGGKFSKSRGEGVFCDDAMNTGIPADVWRYYIMINRPEKEDSYFDWDDFQEKSNKELLGNFGNLVNRTLTFVKKFYDGQVVQVNQTALDFSASYASITQLLENMEQRKALKEIMQISRAANQYFQEQEPWVKVKEDKDAAAQILANLVAVCKDLAILLQPYMPDISKQVFSQLGIAQQDWQELGKPLGAFSIGEVEALFVKLEDERVAEFKDKFKAKVSFSDFDLRVAEIVKVEKHPKADKLFIEHIDLGDEKRVIVSGLVGQYTAEELVGKKILIVANLAPAKLRGVESQGMLLAAGNKEVGLLLADGVRNGFRLHGKKKYKQISIDEFFSVSIEARNGKAYVGEQELKAGEHEILVDKGIVGQVR